MITIEGNPIEIVQKMIAKYIHPESKKIKLSFESNHFFEALIDLIQDFP